MDSLKSITETSPSHQVPNYTAYTEIIDGFGNLGSISIDLTFLPCSYLFYHE